MARKTKTSTEVKNRWNKKTYNRYSVLLRKKEDKKIIDWLEKHKGEIGVTDIFREGAKIVMANYKVKKP